MTTLTITAKGQITLNKALLREIGVAPGDKLRLSPAPGGGFVARPVRQEGHRTIEGLVGRLKRPGQRSISIDEMNDVIARGWAGEP
jgi:antitoxin PrlF